MSPFPSINRKVSTPNDFDDLCEVMERLAQFEARYNRARETVQMEVHHHRPRRLPDPARPTPTPPNPSRLNPINLTPATGQHARAASISDELMILTTKKARLRSTSEEPKPTKPGQK